MPDNMLFLLGFLMNFSAETDVAKRRNPCCVTGCENRHSKRHRFPKNDPEIFTLWVERIQPRNFKVMSVDEIYSKYYVCEEHFLLSDIVPGTKRGLKRTAVPAVNIPGKSLELILNNS